MSIGSVGRVVAAAGLCAVLAAPAAAQSADVRTRAVFTHTAPLAAYRGAGRPEACFLIERLVDEAAARLGVDAAIGTRAWDPHGRVVIRIDGLDLAAFRALLPGRADAGELVALIRAYLGMSVEFAINPALRPDAVPRLQLPKGRAQAADGPRLGWDTWLDQPNRQSGGDEARFPARAIEAAALLTRTEART